MVDIVVPTSVYTSAQELHTFLQACQNAANESLGEGAVYVHDKVFTFPTAQTRANWLSTVPADGRFRALFSDMRTTRKGGGQGGRRRPEIWLGLVGSWVESWVRAGWDATASQLDWHAWAFAVVNPVGGYGRKHLVVWDCDVKDGIDFNTARPRDGFTVGLQERLYREHYPGAT